MENGNTKKNVYLTLPTISGLLIPLLSLIYPIALVTVYLLQLSYFSSSKEEYLHSIGEKLDDNMYSEVISIYKEHTQKKLMKLIGIFLLAPLSAEIITRIIAYFYAKFVSEEKRRSITAHFYNAIFVCGAIANVVVLLYFRNHYHYLFILIPSFVIIACIIFFITRNMKNSPIRGICRFFTLLLWSGIFQFFCRLLCTTEGLSVYIATGLIKETPDGSEYPENEELIDDVTVFVKKVAGNDTTFLTFNKEMINPYYGTAIASWFSKVIGCGMYNPKYMRSTDDYFAIISHELGHLVNNHTIHFMYSTMGLTLLFGSIILLITLLFYRKSKPVNVFLSVMWMSVFSISLVYCIENVITHYNEYVADEHAIAMGYGSVMLEMCENGFSKPPMYDALHHFPHKGHMIFFSHPSFMLRTENMRKALSNHQ